MDFEALRGGLEQAIPFNTHVGLEFVELASGVAVVRLPDDKRLRNHVGSQHASALFAAGEAASGGAFVSVFAERITEVTPLAERAEISYRALALGTITATGRLAEKTEVLFARLDAERRARFPIEVEFTNGKDEVVAEMVVQWYVSHNDG